MKEYIERDRLYELGYWHGATPTLDNPFPDGFDAIDTKDIDSIPAADVRPVVTCSDCKWWTKQESSLQGRCELFQMYPTGAWFCANGKREES